MTSWPVCGTRRCILRRCAGGCDLSAITRSDITRWLMAFADLIAANKDYLTELDSAIGDADHGINMERGFQAVLLKLPGLADQDIGSICKAVGMTLVSTVGGASGPLYGTFFLQLGTASAGKLELTLQDWAAALEAGVDGVKRRGKAVPGDKTMLDSLLPALAALKKAAAQNAEWAEALKPVGAGRPAGDAGYHPADSAQRARQLSGRAQRRSPGPRGDLGAPAAASRAGGLDASQIRPARFWKPFGSSSLVSGNQYGRFGDRIAQCEAGAGGA